MADKGKTQLTFIIVAPPDQVAEGDRIFRSHEPWMSSSHTRSGDKALLSYHVSKAPELTNPMDLNSAATGNTCFVLTEVYESDAGVANHFQLAMSSWKEFPALGKWLEKCKMTAVPAGRIINALW